MRFVVSRGKRSRRIQRRLTLLAAVALATTPRLQAAIELTQADGSQLQLPATAQRVVTLAPHLAELFHAAGAGDHLVATVAWSEHPPAVKQLPRVGDAFRVDREQLLQLNPDLVVAWQSGNPAPIVQGIRDLGIPVWSVEIRQPGEIAATLEQIGTATGQQASAALAADATRRQITELQNDWRGASRVRYFYQVAERPLYTVNGQHLISLGLKLCNGENIFAELESLAPQVGPEAVLARNPEVMFAPASQSGNDPLRIWHRWTGVQAVSNHRLYILPADEISQATPRLLDALAKACRLLHSEPATQQSDPKS